MYYICILCASIYIYVQAIPEGGVAASLCLRGHSSRIWDISTAPKADIIASASGHIFIMRMYICIHIHVCVFVCVCVCVCVCLCVCVCVCRRRCSRDRQ
jgi:hypothetical protein